MTGLKALLFFLMMNIHSNNDMQSFYAQGLRMHLEYLKEIHSGSVKEKYFVEANDFITGGLPNQIGEFDIEYLDHKSIKQKGDLTAFHLIVIRPIEIENNKVILRILDYIVDYADGVFNYAYSGGSKFIYQYDCDKEKYILESKFQKGI